MRLALVLIVTFISLAGCSKTPTPEPEVIKSEIKQLDEMRERERSNK